MADSTWPSGFEQNPIYKLLNKDFHGKIVLKYFEKNICKKSRHYQLAKLIVDNEAQTAFEKSQTTDHKNFTDLFRISADRFQELVNKIMELFPSENSSMYYYCPGTGKKKEEIHASGLLFNHYLHKRYEWKQIMDCKPT